MRVAVVGHVEWIEFARVERVPRPGEIVHASATWEEPGGGGAVAAVQLAKLAGEATFFTALGDDELVLGHRHSEWTGFTPYIEEDVAFSSIAQGEIGHARALYELAAHELGTTADELAFDRSPDEYECSALVELRLVPDWARTIARHVLYEEADAARLAALAASDDPEVAGLAAKIDREETYHRMHAQMWSDRLENEPRFRSAREALRPQLEVREPGPELTELWEEMTSVRRSVAGATW